VVGSALIENPTRVSARPEFATTGAMWIWDESADEKSDKSAGAGRQHMDNGRHGKVYEAQVGVYLAYVKQTQWTHLDGCFMSKKEKQLRSARKSGLRHCRATAGGSEIPVNVFPNQSWTSAGR